VERSQIYFTKQEKDFFKKEAKEKGISMAELIRRVLDNYIDKKQSNEK
jgi:hypothetical protein